MSRGFAGQQEKVSSTTTAFTGCTSAERKCGIYLSLLGQPVLVRRSVALASWDLAMSQCRLALGIHGETFLCAARCKTSER
jgi:hypothetical protein